MTSNPRHNGFVHPAFEEYCEAIFELREDDIEVIQARIADRLSVSRPAVSEMLKRMQASGLVVIDKVVQLTPAGLELAEGVVRRHRLAERFLTDVLKLSWAEAHHEAGKWEHVISPIVEDAMRQMLEDPSTCPHGNPIPGAAYDPGDTELLGTLQVGDRFRITRITEELEAVDGLLTFLEGHGIVPTRDGAVLSTSPDGTMTLRLGDGDVGLSPFVTGRISVIVLGPAHPSTQPHQTER